MTSVPFSRPYFGAEEEAAVAEVVRSGWVVGGPQLQRFERRMAERAGAREAVGVSSWTTGAFLVLKALGIGPGDEVIVPSLTFIASVNVIRHAGATPVLVDVDPLTYNLDPALVEPLITPRTRAIMPIDQIGLPCDIDAVTEIAERHGLVVIEDAACAIGSRYRGRPVGCSAPVTVFSLHARKVLTTGEGGMIVTNDAELAARLRRLRHQGMSASDFERKDAVPTRFETYPEIGYNFRITDIQAALGNCQLDRLDWLLARRAEVARRYREGLADLPGLRLPHVPDYAEPNWQSYQICVTPEARLDRNALMETLHSAGIQNRRGVMASHREAPYRDLGCHLPHTEACADRCLQLPMHPALDGKDVDRVVDAVRTALAA